MALVVKNRLPIQETEETQVLITWVMKIPWRRTWQTIANLSHSSLEKPHGQRSLVGYSR